MMSRLLASTILVLAVLSGASSAWAQFVYRGPWSRAIAVGTGLRLATGGYGYRHPYYGYGYGGGTAYGDYSRGMAQVIRARGEAARDYTQAQINQQVARSKYLDNQKKWNEIHRARKQAAEAERQKKREEQRAAARQRQLHPAPPPARISFLPGDRNAKTGKLNWPAVLQSSEFALQREEIQKQFDLKARTQATPAIKDAIIKSAMAMKTALRAKVKVVAVNDIMAGLDFLDRMMHEAGR